MKFTLSRDKLLEVLQQVQSVVSTRTTLPILSNILIKAQKSGLSMTATDLDVGVQSSIESGNRADEAAPLFPARRFFQHRPQRVACQTDVRHRDRLEEHREAFAAASTMSKIVGLPEDDFRPCTEIRRVAARLRLKQAELEETD